MTPERFREAVEAEWQHGKDGPATLTREEVERVTRALHASGVRKPRSAVERLRPRARARQAICRMGAPQRASAQGAGLCGRDAVAQAHRVCRRAMPPPTRWMPVADLADRYSFGELRVTHEQNLLLPDVRQSDLYAVWQEAQALGLATPNIGMITNIIACPGGDYCSLANAKSIPVAEAIQRRFDDLDYVYDIGELDLNISGCMNSCGHHHIGHIGILGVDKQGAEFYQISIGGAQGNDASLGKVLGPFGLAGRGARRRREADRGLSRAPRQRSRALHRRRAAHRHRTFQGTRLWRSSRIESSRPTAGSCLRRWTRARTAFCRRCRRAT